MVPEERAPLTIRNGYLVCPECLKNRHLMRILPSSVGLNIQVQCRFCKKEILIDIVEGQCFKSQCR